MLDDSLLRYLLFRQNSNQTRNGEHPVLRTCRVLLKALQQPSCYEGRFCCNDPHHKMQKIMGVCPSTCHIVHYLLCPGAQAAKRHLKETSTLEKNRNCSWIVTTISVCQSAVLLSEDLEMGAILSIAPDPELLPIDDILTGCLGCSAAKISTLANRRTCIRDDVSFC